jgi:hypothetical protein
MLSQLQFQFVEAARVDDIPVGKLRHVEIDGKFYALCDRQLVLRVDTCRNTNAANSNGRLLLNSPFVVDGDICEGSESSEGFRGHFLKSTQNHINNRD